MKPIEFVYRSGPIRCIKEFIPRLVDKTHDDKFKSFPVLYASSDPSYAAGFCFDWSDDEGFIFSKSNKDPWTLTVPKKYRDRLHNKCSLYKLDGSLFTRIPNLKTPEYMTKHICKVLEEKKYNSSYECLKDNVVKLKFV